MQNLKCRLSLCVSLLQCQAKSCRVTTLTLLSKLPSIQSCDPGDQSSCTSFKLCTRARSSGESDQNYDAASDRSRRVSDALLKIRSQRKVGPRSGARGGKKRKGGRRSLPTVSDETRATKYLPLGRVSFVLCSWCFR